jgi:dipeptidyl aminopeptidase/acylaminoacyl peptidase
VIDVNEVFDVVTRQARPDPGAPERQRRRQDSRQRRRRVTAIAGTAVIVAAVVVGFAFSQHDAQSPAHSAAPSVTRSRVHKEHVIVVSLDGSTQTVTGVPANAESPTMSPDGHTIAFVASKHGTPQLGLIRTDGTGLRFITDSQLTPFTPAWSPDGSRIAFAQSVLFGQTLGQDIFIINANGTHLRRLTSDGRSIDQWPTWSPDGTTIAYSVSGKGPGDSGFYKTQEIWTVPAGGGKPVRLTYNNVFDDMPSYSPDGTTIAYSQGGRIWVMDANGTRQHVLLDQPPGTSNFNPRWAPVGNDIMILTYDPSLRPVTRDDGGNIVPTWPLLTIHVEDLSTGAVTSIQASVASDINAPSWLPSGAALLVNQYPR